MTQVLYLCFAHYILKRLSLLFIWLFCSKRSEIIHGVSGLTSTCAGVLCATQAVGIHLLFRIGEIGSKSCFVFVFFFHYLRAFSQKE